MLYREGRKYGASLVDAYGKKYRCFFHRNNTLGGLQELVGQTGELQGSRSRSAAVQRSANFGCRAQRRTSVRGYPTPPNHFGPRANPRFHPKKRLI
jgi:hypothetical protein